MIEKISQMEYKRVNYNFYTKSAGSEHVDSETPNCVSILIINTNDGYTEILNENIKVMNPSYFI